MSISEMPQLPLRCQRCAVRSESLCADLSTTELTALNAISRRRTLEAGQTVVLEGEPDVFGNVVSGLLAERKALPDGREQIVSLLFPADFHGNPHNALADASVHAVSDAEICQFERTSFERLCAKSPQLRRVLFDHALAALADAREWMLLLGRKTAGERVATFLLRLAQRQARAGCAHEADAPPMDGMTVEIPLTRAQIASYLGLTIETVSRRLTVMREAHLIDFASTRSVRLLDIARLRTAASSR